MWKQGQSGNPLGAQREKKFLAALDRAIAQDKGALLRAAAEKLLQLASQGEPWAVKELADRIDGKAVQQLDMSLRDERERDLSDAELARIAAGGRDRTVKAKGRAQKPPELH